MISEKDTQFLRYWEQNKQKENKLGNKLLNGLPMAVMFGMPVILSFIVVRLFFPDYYTKISGTSPGMMATIVFAVLLIIIFYAYFRMQYKWEMNEQLYQELKVKENKEQAGETFVSE